MSRRKVKMFDPSAELGTLISALERKTGIRSEVDPQHITTRVNAAAEDFKRGVLALHRAEGDSSGVEVLLGEIERVARRAVRMADEYGAPCAPQTADGATNASAGRATALSTNSSSLTTSQVRGVS